LIKDLTKNSCHKTLDIEEYGNKKDPLKRKCIDLETGNRKMEMNLIRHIQTVRSLYY